MPFIPNTDSVVIRQEESVFNRFGEPEFREKRIPVRCAIIKLDLMRSKTAVRQDSSASRGQASEEEANVRLLFPPSFDIRIGDLVALNVAPQDMLRVLSVMPRLDIAGRLDHFQVDLEVWVP